MLNNCNNNNEIEIKKQLLLAILRESKIKRMEKAFISEQFCSQHGDFAQVRALLERLDKSTFEMAGEEIVQVRAAGADIICIGESAYPCVLKEMSDPPLVLFIRGNKIWLEQETITQPLLYLAIVGMRKASSEGCRFARQLAHELTASKVCIVSGLAYGIDTAAHQGAVMAVDDAKKSGALPLCPGIAVLGSGVNNIYPARNRALAQEIIAGGGCIISEYGLDAEPLAYRFPERNRIVSGFVSGVIVVEAASRSGSLITARLALEEGRDVFAVPGAINSESAEGTNNLLKQGAILVTSAEDILRHYWKIKFHQPEATKATANISSENKILHCLNQHKSLSFDEIVEKTGNSSQKVAAELTILEMTEEIYRHPGNLISIHRFIDN
ncbi:MAG: DNA-protecting protein DprA [Deltaproteobacteria bacterium]|nr:DNA-protecting protein DprA [Deltaproteobacteria bacterium]